MDFTGIIGLVVGILLMIFGILSSILFPGAPDPGTVATPITMGIILDQLANFGDMASVLITIGGTFAATVCSFPIGAFKDVGKHMKVAFSKNKNKPLDYIQTIVEFAQDARRKGILSLEDKVAEQEDEFMKKSVMLIVDAIEPAKTKTILENELDNLDTRHSASVKIYEKASGFAPAFGMIGTLIGLVNMLAGLDLDSADGASKLTDGMAVALITTLYGSLLANLILTPIANKLRYRHAEEMMCKEIVVEGVIAIQSGDNPKHIEERLLAFLPQDVRNSASSSGSADSDDGEEGGKKGKKAKKSKKEKAEK